MRKSTEINPREPLERTTVITALVAASSTRKLLAAKLSTPGAFKLSTMVSVALVNDPSAAKLVEAALLSTKPTV